MSDLLDPTAILDGDVAGRRAVRGGALRFVGYGVSTLLSLIGVAVVTRHLGTDEYGRYQTVFSLISVVASITDAGMGALGVREYAQRTGRDRDDHMRALLGMRLALSMAGIVIATGIAVALGFSSALVLGTVLAGVGLLLTMTQGTLAIPLIASLRNEWLAAVDVIRQALQVAGLVVGVVAGLGVAALLAVPVPVGIVVVAVMVVLVRGSIPLRPSFRSSEWMGMLRPALAFALAMAVGTVYLYTSQILTQAVTSAHQAGLFAASFRIFIVTIQVPALLVTVTFPLLSRFASNDRDRLQYALQRLFETMSLLGLAAAVGLVVAAHSIIYVMAGPAFTGSVDPLRIQAVAMIASFLLAPMAFGLLSLHRHREILVANLVALTVSVVGVTILAGAHGAIGAAIGAALGEVTLAAMYAIGLVRAAPELRPRLGRSARGLVCAGIAIAAGLLCGLPAWAGGILALVLYGLLLLLVRAIPQELIVELRRR